MAQTTLEVRSASAYPPLLVQIDDKDGLDNILSQSKHGTPTLILVYNSSMPICATLQRHYAQIAADYANSTVCFGQMDYSNRTSMLFKFSPNQLPVTVFTYRDEWAKTMMAASKSEIEGGVRELLAKVESLYARS